MAAVPPLADTDEEHLLGDYRPAAGAVDELLDADGRLRPVWHRFIVQLAALPRQELEARMARAWQYMHDAGVYYRVYDAQDSGRSRTWPLAPVPVLIDEDEWALLARGLAQRAELLEQVVADLYGPQALVGAGLIPAELVAGNPGFLRPLVGVAPRDGHYLHFCAFELGRGPDGRWWVLGDRTQAPSGAGFALENRVATRRAFPDLPADMHVHRLAGFFRRFRDALVSLADGRSGEIGILTPGSGNETYYEHAWIARYLGILLLEGDDLTVREGQLRVRTVSGLQPVSVLWRRMDAAYMDPLELRQDSWIGTPGSVGALRAGQVSMVNALGAGLLEARALQAFLPSICQHLEGRGLILPGIATWWCGQPEVREGVLNRLDSLMLGPAGSNRLPYEDPHSTVLAAQLDPDERAQLLRRLREDGAQWVAQEAVTLSTTPAWIEGRLEARPFVLRAFVARTAQGWEVMPGGFARVGAHTDARAIAMQHGGQAADVWVVSAQPVDGDTLLAGHDLPRPHATAGALPSRAAENLLWLGRYAERGEAIARRLRAYHARLAENPHADGTLPDLLAANLAHFDVEVAEAIPAGLLRCLDGASYSAGRIRDRFSPDGWSALNDLSRTAYRFAGQVESGDDASRAVTVLLRKLAGFSGLLHENMYRSTGWRFLEAGRRIERGIHTAQLLAALRRDSGGTGLQQAVLEIGDSVMTHRSRYGVGADASSVVELLALDPDNPRSVIHQVDILREQLGLLPQPQRASMPPFVRHALRLHTGLSTLDAHDLDAAGLDRLAHDIGQLYEQLAAAYFA